MNRNPYARIAAIAVGACVLFGLEQGLSLQLYIAIPVAILAYIATLLVMGRVLGASAK